MSICSFLSHVLLNIYIEIIILYGGPADTSLFRSSGHESPTCGLFDSLNCIIYKNAYPIHILMLVCRCVNNCRDESQHFPWISSKGTLVHNNSVMSIQRCLGNVSFKGIVD